MFTEILWWVFQHVTQMLNKHLLSKCIRLEMYDHNYLITGCYYLNFNMHSLSKLTNVYISYSVWVIVCNSGFPILKWFLHLWISSCSHKIQSRFWLSLHRHLVWHSLGHLRPLFCLSIYHTGFKRWHMWSHTYQRNQN